MLNEAAIQQFHRAVAAGFARVDRLGLYSLTADEGAVAMLYGLVERDRFCFYACGFDPAFGSFSPGTVLLGKVIEDAIARGLRTFDFLRGDESYKAWWGARRSMSIRRTLVPSTTSGRGRAS